MEAAAAPARIERGSLSVLFAMSIALVAITLDLSPLNVAVPAMEDAFQPSVGRSPRSPDSERSLAGAIIFTLRVGGGALGLGLMTAIVASSSGFLAGFRAGFRVNAVFAALALLVTLLAVRRR